MKEWRVETPNSADALQKTLDKVTREGWTVEYVMPGAGGIARARLFTVVASREAEA